MKKKILGAAMAVVMSVVTVGTVYAAPEVETAVDEENLAALPSIQKSSVSGEVSGAKVYGETTISASNASTATAPQGGYWQDYTYLRLK